MSRLNLTHLEAKPKSRSPKRAGSKLCPYTSADALKEDSDRARLIRRAAKTVRKKTQKALRKAAKRLGKRLTYRDNPPLTLASAAYLFDLRERIVDHLVRLTWKVPEGEVFTATLIPRNNAHATLDNLKAAAWMERLRADLTREKGREAEGWIFASLHGEYQPDVELYDVHYHLVIRGEQMKAVIERLRDHGKYQIAEIEPADSKSTRTPPIHIKTVKRDELRFAFTYIVQTWWPKRWRGRNTQGSRFVGKRRRIDGMRHTDWLLWMDRQPLTTPYLLFNLEVQKRGLTVKRAKARTSIQKDKARETVALPQSKLSAPAPVGFSAHRVGQHSTLRTDSPV